jgi:tRNA G10  N-methylase Trm11
MLEDVLRIFDPLCGRGTTLNQVLVYGWDAAGMDVDGKDYEAYASFIRTYLQRKRIKHVADEGPVRRNQKHIGRRLTAELGLNREDYKAGDKRQLTVVNADTLTAPDFFPASSFDAIVTDAPYGVQHGSHAQSGGLRRSPLELLEAALPAWSRVLRPGGAVGVAWNTFVADRSATASVFAAAGLKVMDEEPYLGFRHRVDQAIMRDIIVARKPRP